MSRIKSVQGAANVLKQACGRQVNGTEISLATKKNIPHGRSREVRRRRGPRKTCTTTAKPHVANRGRISERARPEQF